LNPSVTYKKHKDVALDRHIYVVVKYTKGCEASYKNRYEEGWSDRRVEKTA
jgi:hypothetical protein